MYFASKAEIISGQSCQYNAAVMIYFCKPEVGMVPGPLDKNLTEFFRK